MSDLVTLDEAKAFLRVEHAEEDHVIAMIIGAASDAVRDVASGWDGVGPVPDRLKLAVLQRVTIAWERRDTMAAGGSELQMLTPLRALEV